MTDYKNKIYPDKAKWTEFRRTFGQNLKAARLAQGMSLDEFSEKSGYKVEKILKFENGTTNFDFYSVFRFAHILKIPIQFLIK